MLSIYNTLLEQGIIYVCIINLLQHTSMLKIERICYSLDTFLLHKRFAYCTGHTLVSESF